MHFDKQMLVSRPYSKRLRKCQNFIATEITQEKEDSTDLSRFFDVSFIITEQWRRPDDAILAGFIILLFT